MSLVSFSKSLVKSISNGRPNSHSDRDRDHERLEKDRKSRREGIGSEGNVKGGGAWINMMSITTSASAQIHRIVTFDMIPLMT